MAPDTFIGYDANMNVLHEYRGVQFREFYHGSIGTLRSSFQSAKHTTSDIGMMKMLIDGDVAPPGSHVIGTPAWSKEMAFRAKKS